MNHSISNKSSLIKTKKDFKRETVERVDTNVLTENLQEFMQISKEKLSNLKQDIDQINKENDLLNSANKSLDVQYQEFIELNKNLDLQIKGAKQLLIYKLKNKVSLLSQIKELNLNIEAKNINIETLNIENSYALNALNIKKDYNINVRETNEKNYSAKLAHEMDLKDNLKVKIKEIENEIERYKAMTQELKEQNENRTSKLLKEAAEMEKYLSSL